MADAESTVSWDTDLEAGLLDNYDLTITRAFFAPDQSYAEGNVTILQWEGKTDDADVPETHLWFPTGKGWSSKNGGKSIVHDSGKADKFFVRNSLMGRLIKRCVDDFGIKDLLSERGGPLESAVWVGLQFHIKREDIEFGGNFNPVNKEFPQRFLGVASGVGAGDATPPASTASSEPTAAEKMAALKAKSATNGGGGGLRDQVHALAKQHDDFQSFQDAALQIEGVNLDDDLIAELVDESGIYTTARA